MTKAGRIQNGIYLNADDYEAVRCALKMISGKWRLEILWLLYHRTHRFGELLKTIRGISQHVLTKQLRELEADGLITRKDFARFPPRVEYSITNASRELEPTIHSLMAWWEQNGRKSTEQH